MPFGLSVSILPSDLPLNGFPCGVPGEVALPDLTLQGFAGRPDGDQVAGG
jgi:hypothetical protein